jgi:hypothetical protein
MSIARNAPRKRSIRMGFLRERRPPVSNHVSLGSTACSEEEGNTIIELGMVLGNEEAGKACHSGRQPTRDLQFLVVEKHVDVFILYPAIFQS